MGALGYVRVSTERQAEKGLGLQAQEQAVRTYCKGRTMRLRRVYREGGVSGAIEDRPQLGRLLHELQAGDVVVVARLDRLARDLVTQELLLRDIRGRGADLASCSEAEEDYLRDDPEDPTRKLIRHVLGAVSEFERSLVRLRLRRGRALKATMGGYAYGAPPFGFRSENGELIPVEGEQAAIRRAHQLRGQGNSLRSIGKRLEEEGFSPRRGRHWHPTTVARITSSASREPLPPSS